MRRGVCGGKGVEGESVKGEGVRRGVCGGECGGKGVEGESVEGESVKGEIGRG